jgi:hypothetical protein
MSLYDRMPRTAGENIANRLASQKLSTDMWVGKFDKWPDGCGVRNASLALGKWMGLYEALGQIQPELITQEMQATMRVYADAWERIENVPLRQYERLA